MTTELYSVNIWLVFYYLTKLMNSCVICITVGIGTSFTVWVETRVLQYNMIVTLLYSISQVKSWLKCTIKYGVKLFLGISWASMLIAHLSKLIYWSKAHNCSNAYSGPSRANWCWQCLCTGLSQSYCPMGVCWDQLKCWPLIKSRIQSIKWPNTYCTLN